MQNSSKIPTMPARYAAQYLRAQQFVRIVRREARTIYGYCLETMPFQIFSQPVESLEQKTRELSTSSIGENFFKFFRTQLKQVTKIGLAIVIVSTNGLNASQASMTPQALDRIWVASISLSQSSTSGWIDSERSYEQIQPVVSKDKECNEHLIECPSKTPATRWLEF